MFLTLFLSLREAKVPVSLREYLTLIEAIGKGLGGYSAEEFYYLARSALVKDEKNLDKFDRVFASVVHGAVSSASAAAELTARIPEEWLRQAAERLFTPEEMAQIQAMGGFDALMKALAERLAEQKSAHSGGNKWIGTNGTSPFGSGGFNPAGIRIGNAGQRQGRATKAWERREFRNLDDTVELGTRTFRLALRRLRRFAREGAANELDLDGTITATARSGGLLDVKMRPERHNRIKVLLLLDVGGSMDPHVRLVEELFSAARSEFKHLEHFYFHNCPYGWLWRDNRRRETDGVSTWEVLRTFPPDWKLVIVGDAAMSPWEITVPGAAVEEWNDEPGHLWLERIFTTWPSAAWLSPLPEGQWRWTDSVRIIQGLSGDRMYPLTLDGLDGAMRTLNRQRSS